MSLARFDAMLCVSIAVGNCIIYDEDDDLVYAGPLDAAPEDIGGFLVLLNPVDFHKLTDYVSMPVH